MSKIMLVTEPQHRQILEQRLSAKGRHLLLADESQLVSAAECQTPDVLILQICQNSSFYTRRLMELHQKQINPFIILFHLGDEARYAASSPLEVASTKRCEESRQIESDFFNTLCLLSPSAAPKKYSHVDTYTARFEATEYLREIVSGVSDEVFDAITKDQCFQLAPRGHFLMLIQITSSRRFDDYTFNRDVFYFLEERRREEVYALLCRNGGEFFGASKSFNCVLFNAPNIASSARCIQYVDTLCRELVRIIDDGYCAFYISKLIPTPAGINTAYRELLSISRYKRLFPDETVLDVDEILRRKSMPDFVQLQNITQKIGDLTVDSEDKLFRQLFHQLFEIAKSSVSITAFNYCCDALSMLHIYFSGSPKASVDSISASYTAPQKLNIDEAEHYFLDKFLKTKQVLLEENSRYDPVIRTLFQYIDKHYAEKLSLDKLAARVGLSRVYVCKKFKHDVGVNLSDYIETLRIEKAKQLLKQGLYRINEVAPMVGFQNEKYFSKVFHRSVGMTPTEFMRA